MEAKYDSQFKVVFDAIRQLMTPPAPAKPASASTSEDPPLPPRRSLAPVFTFVFPCERRPSCEAGSQLRSVEELGGNRVTEAQSARKTCLHSHAHRPAFRRIAFEITTGGGIPDAKTRAAIHKHVSEQHLENLLIFLDSARSQSLWYWVKREAGKAHARDHLYVKGQPGDLFLEQARRRWWWTSANSTPKATSPSLEVANRLKAALDVERVTKKFYAEFDTQRLASSNTSRASDDDHQRRWYASVLMNRLMFI